MTFLENRKVIEWMEAVACERSTDLSVILREATSFFYLQHRNTSPEVSLTAQRAAVKATQRAKTARQIKAGALSPSQAQEINAPVNQPVRMLNLWSSIRQHVRERSV